MFKSFTHDFLLLESCAFPIILGTDFMTKNDCLINMQTSEFCCEPSRPIVSSCINTISFHINDKLHLYKLCNMLATEFIDCFARCENDRGRCNLVQHHIELQDNRPIKNRSYRQPQLLKRSLDKAINSMLDSGVTRHSKSSWVSPFFLVRKKDGRYRFVVDYRKLNNKTNSDCFPVPLIEDIVGFMDPNTLLP